MRAVFGLFTALPIDFDPDEVDGGWVATALVGLALGVGWLVFHQLFSRLGGPFVAAGGLLLLHAALTGARPLRGVVGVVETITQQVEGDEQRGMPDPAGAGAVVVAAWLLLASSLLIRVDLAPAVLVMVPIVGKSVQALLLGSGDDGVGPVPPTAVQKGVIVLTSVATLVAAPLLSDLVRPERVDPPVDGAGYVLLGVAAMIVAVLAGLLARAWLRARLGAMGPNAWHAVGAVTELSALAVVALHVS